MRKSEEPRPTAPVGWKELEARLLPIPHQNCDLVPAASTNETRFRFGSDTKTFVVIRLTVKDSPRFLRSVTGFHDWLSVRRVLGVAGERREASTTS